jgi:hypothetical protein
METSNTSSTSIPSVNHDNSPQTWIWSIFSSSSTHSSLSSSITSLLVNLSQKNISSSALANLSSLTIKSSMYLTYYHPSRSFTCFNLPTNERLFFIVNSSLINQLTHLETSENNIFTKRVQSYQYNSSLLSSNPVSNPSLNHQNYVRNQHQLFVKLAQELDLSDITFPQQIVSDSNLVEFVINITAQVYLPMLLNIHPSRVPEIMTDFIKLLDLLELATGKHNITFQDYLDHKIVEYSDVMEQKYIRLFYRIVLKLTATDKIHDLENLQFEQSATLEELCQVIITQLASSNLVSVLSSLMDSTNSPGTQARVMVNNILSWLDNMLNVVHTLVNLIILIGQKNHGIYTKEFYISSLPNARALATMFMRHVLNPFQITKDNGYPLQFRKGDIIMMSNGNSDTLFGGKGRKCPSRPWSYRFMSQMMELITTHYVIQYTPSSANCFPSFSRSRTSVPPQDSENNSWFWNKFSTKGVQLIPINSAPERSREIST